MSALHLTVSKSVQTLDATRSGVHTNAAGHSRFPFTQGDLQEHGETRNQAKRNIK